MKKNIAIVIAVCILLLGSGLIFYYYSQFITVPVSFGPDVTSASFRSLSDTDRSFELTNTTDKVVLKKGRYSYIPRGENIDSTPIIIDIRDSSSKITVAPDYSPEYLSRLADDAKGNISSVFRAKYPTALLEQYTLDRFIVSQRGEWCGGILVNKLSTPNDIRDFYRFVCKKDGDGWSIVSYPRLVLSSYDFKDVPVSVLDKINSLEPTVN